MTVEDFLRRYKFEITDEIGSGGFARVYKAYDETLDEWVAIKVAPFNPETPQFSLQEEVERAQKLPKHANLAHYRECYRFKQTTGIFDYAIMQYYSEGNLMQLTKKVALNDAQLAGLIKGIITGIKHMHDHSIVHRDLKPSNILIIKRQENYIPKITDFGISKFVEDNSKTVFEKSTVVSYTLSYASPEIVNGETNLIKKNTDLWSFGVIMYELLNKAVPFESGISGNSERDRQEKIRRIIDGKLPEAINKIGEPYNQIIKRCLVVDINKRAQSAGALLKIIDDFELVKINGKKGAPVNPSFKPITKQENGSESETALKEGDAKHTQYDKPKQEDFIKRKSAKNNTGNSNSKSLIFTKTESLFEDFVEWITSVWYDLLKPAFTYILKSLFVLLVLYPIVWGFLSFFFPKIGQLIDFGRVLNWLSGQSDSTKKIPSHSSMP